MNSSSSHLGALGVSVVNPPSGLPSISVVVPNLNGGAMLGQALDSLLAQNYPGLEILVVDGGSADDSVEIIRRYQDRLAWWVSEKDRGQAHAINKGFARCTGQIVNWLCGDDLLMPGALHAIGRAFAQPPEPPESPEPPEPPESPKSPQPDVVVGGWRQVLLHRGGETRDFHASLERIEMLPIVVPFSQPACFYRRDLLLDRPTPLDESYHYQMDVELWCHFKSKGVRWKIIDELVGVDRFDLTTKTGRGGPKIADEAERIYRTYTHERIPLTFWHRRLRYPLERFRHRHPEKLAFALARPLQIATALALGPFYGLKRVRAMNWSSWT